MMGCQILDGPNMSSLPLILTAWLLINRVATSSSPISQLGTSTVTIAMMNWQRPANVLKIIEAYEQYEIIAEVIVWMCREDTRLLLSHDSHPKVRLIDDASANEKHGLSTRFKACLLSKTPWVFIQDDDHFMTEPGLARMMEVKAAYPKRIVGAFGRDWPQGQAPQYLNEFPVRPGPCRIILTILMLTDVSTCQAFWEHAPKVESFVKRNSKPFWNGEDIFFSLVSFKVMGELPLLVRGDKVFMPQEDAAIHVLYRGHFRYRDNFLKYAVKALQLQFPPEAWSSGNGTDSGGGGGWRWMAQGKGLQKGRHKERKQGMLNKE